MLRSKKPKHSSPPHHRHRHSGGAAGITASKSKNTATFTTKATTKAKATTKTKAKVTTATARAMKKITSQSPSQSPLSTKLFAQPIMSFSTTTTPTTPSVEDLLRSQLAEANAKIAAQQQEANAKLAAANAKITELSLLKNVPLPLVGDVPYEDRRTFWSTNCNARNAKLKDHILTKQPLSLGDFVAILKNNAGDVTKAVHDCSYGKSNGGVHILTQYFPLALTLTNTPITTAPCIDLNNHIRVEIESANRPYNYKEETYTANVYGAVVINGGASKTHFVTYEDYENNGSIFKEKITKFVSAIFSPEKEQHKQRLASLYLIDLSTINADNIDTIDLTKINLYDLVPKDKRGAYIFETTRKIEPYISAPWADDRGGDTTVEELFATITLNDYDEKNYHSFDFDTFEPEDQGEM